MKVCACKGIRTCLLCEPFIEKSIPAIAEILYFCPTIKKVVTEDCSSDCGVQHMVRFEINGVTVVDNFILEEERQHVLSQINSDVWNDSQSGRRKQDYGPKVNFKRQKVRMASFTGLPGYARAVLARAVSQLPELAGFEPVELCNLQYDPERGASIDAHRDDAWLWGERLVTLNWAGEARLCLTLPPDYHHQQNAVLVPLRQGSLTVLAGEARHLWQHAIRRQDVCGGVRVASTVRELSAEFQAGGPRYEEVGRDLLVVAASYSGRDHYGASVAMPDDRINQANQSKSSLSSTGQSEDSTKSLDHSDFKDQTNQSMVVAE